MTTYDWHTTYRNAVEAFGGSTPGAELEQEILDTFQHSPQTVVQAIAKAEHLLKAGKITSPWGIVRSELHRVSSQPHLQVTDSRSRDNRIAKAEQWIRQVGLMLDQDEIITHLFAPRAMTASVEFLEQLERDTRGNVGRPLYDGFLKLAIRKTRAEGPQPIPGGGGPLTDLDTPALRDRMIHLWQQLQPTAEAIRAEENAAADAWKRQQKENPWNRPSASTTPSVASPPEQEHPCDHPTKSSAQTIRPRTSTPPDAPTVASPAGTGSSPTAAIATTGNATSSATTSAPADTPSPEPDEAQSSRTEPDPALAHDDLPL